MINPIDGKIKQVMQQGVAWLETWVKRWTKPATSKQVMGTLADLERSKSELIAENMFLRQQLVVLERQVSHPPLTQRDRQVLVLLASRIKGWREALIVVKAMDHSLVGDRVTTSVVAVVSKSDQTQTRLRLPKYYGG